MQSVKKKKKNPDSIQIKKTAFARNKCGLWLCGNMKILLDHPPGLKQTLAQQDCLFCLFFD